MGTVIKTQQTELYWASLAGVVNKAVSITGISGLGGAREAVDTSNLDTGVDRTYIAGSGSPGQVTVAFNVRRGELAHRALMDLRDSGDVVSWGVYSSEAATAPKAVAAQLQTASGRVSARFMGFVADVSVDMSGNSVWRGTIVIQRSGGVTWDLMTPDEELAAMFVNGEQGAWYDPSDWSTLFQDAAGTVPVTALEQPVGRMLDKSGRGNHASQATAGSRPVLSARVNLLTYSEQFDNAAWLKDAAGVISANAALAPDGTMTADTLTVTGANVLRQTITKAAVDGVYAGSIWLRKLAGTGAATVRFVANGSVIAPSVVTPDLSLGNWVRVQVAGSSGAFTDLRFDVSTTTSGDSFALWGAQVQQAAGPYQRIAAAADYDVVGFPNYLRFDGVAMSMQTSSIDLTATSKLAVVAGVSTATVTGTQMLLELGGAYSSAVGRFEISLNEVRAGAFTFARRAIGAISVYASEPVQAAPRRAVLSSVSDFAVAQGVSLRTNGVDTTGLVANSGTAAGYTNEPLFIGSRSGTGLRFSGNLYSLLLLGRLPTSTELAALEARAALRAGVTL